LVALVFALFGRRLHNIRVNLVRFHNPFWISSAYVIANLTKVARSINFKRTGNYWIGQWICQWASIKCSSYKIATQSGAGKEAFQVGIIETVEEKKSGRSTDVHLTKL